MSDDDFNSITSMSSKELMGLMFQMKPLFEREHQKAKQTLIDNPVLTRSLFQAQVMVGLTQTRSDNLQKTLSQLKSTEFKQHSDVQSTQSMTLSESQSSSPQPSVSASRLLSPPQPSPPLPTAPIPSLNFSSQTLPSVPPHSVQFPSISAPNSSQIRNFPPPPPVPPLHQFSAPQAQPSLQMSGVFHQPFQSPSLQQPRPPPMQHFPHQFHSQIPQGLGFQPGTLPQHLLSQPMFHPGSNTGSSFPLGQPPLPSQPPPQYLYQGRPHIGLEYNNQMQAERSAHWGPRFQERTNGGLHFPGPPGMFLSQMATGAGGVGGQQPPPPLAPETEKALLQQVMSLTPEQINMLPPEQRQQVIQLQEMLR